MLHVGFGPSRKHLRRVRDPVGGEVADVTTRPLHVEGKRATEAAIVPRTAR